MADLKLVDSTDTIDSTADLESRIAAAFADGAESTTVAALIKETEHAAHVAELLAERYRTRALDPVQPKTVVTVARRLAADSEFARDRLRSCTARLGDRLTELLAAEENQRRRAIWDRVTAQRDVLAAELRDVYPACVLTLTDLLARIEANNRDCASLLPPSGMGRPLDAERVARGSGGVVNGVEMLSIVRDVRLPAFERSPEPYAWPPPPKPWAT